MFYRLLKLYARFAIQLYCRKIIINQPEILKSNGPLLIAANHPNSFLDGIILTTLFKNGVYSLARGDAFKNKRYNAFLRSIFLLPVYRTSEGAENLTHNYATFAACQEVFKRGGIVLIFSEGRCINEWHLRPLKKGTARLALSCWQQGIPVTVLPLGFNYSPFRVFGKNVHLNFGKPLEQTVIVAEETEGKQLLRFNEQLEKELGQLVYEIPSTDVKKAKEKLYVPQPLLKKILLFIPAFFGAVLHAPLYAAAKGVTNVYFDNDHWDSVFNSLLVLAYPLYLIFLLILLACFFPVWMALLVVALLPFCAWAFVQIKPQGF